MDVIFINAESKIAEMAFSIAHHAKTWRKWFAIRIELRKAIASEDEAGFATWLGAVLQKCLPNMRGQAYFCDGQCIHIICKGGNLQSLEEAAAQITSLLLEEYNSHAYDAVFCLEEEGLSYVGAALYGTGGIFSVAVAKDSDPIAALNAHREADAMTRAAPDQNLKRVLLIEDDPVTRWIVRRGLKNKCLFASASGAKQGVAAFQSFKPDVVFLDIHLPDGNGRELLPSMLDIDPGIRVVMFSSLDNLDNLTATLNSGASGFIPKPFNKDVLLSYIEG
jgi:CheY-like chemotaxis protein